MVAIPRPNIAINVYVLNTEQRQFYAGAEAASLNPERLPFLRKRK